MYINNFLDKEKKIKDRGNDFYGTVTGPQLNTFQDIELVRKFVEKADEDAFNELVKRYVNMVYGVSFRLLKDLNLAEEVFQEVFLILNNKLGTFREESKFSTWLYRITLNVCYVYRKNEYKHHNNYSLDYNYESDMSSDLMEQLEDTKSINPGDESIRTEILEIVEKEIACLPYKYRIVCMLRDIEGLTNPEVSKILNISVAAVKSRILRARNILKNRLKSKLDIIRD